MADANSQNESPQTFDEWEEMAIEELPALEPGDEVEVKVKPWEASKDADVRSLAVSNGEIPEWASHGLMQRRAKRQYLLTGYGTEYVMRKTELYSGKCPRVWLCWKSEPFGRQVVSVDEVSA